jgi:NitT/TauT family transport system substrate-binding protein
VAFAPLIEAQSRGEGALLADGTPVTIAVFPTPPELIAAYASGRVDAATLPSNAAAVLSARGQSIQVAATFLWGVLYVVGPRGEALESIRGEVETVGRGATPDFVFRFVLAEEGLADQITPSYGFAQVELSQLLIAGRERYGVLPEPFVSRVLRENRDLGVVADLQARFFSATGMGLPQTVLAVRPDGNRGEQLYQLLMQSAQTVIADPAAAAATVEALEIGLDAETVIDALPRLHLRVESGRESEQALRAYLEILYSFAPQSVGGSLPAPSFYGQ